LYHRAYVVTIVLVIQKLITQYHLAYNVDGAMERSVGNQRSRNLVGNQRSRNPGKEIQLR
jgi:hypothetical protein